MTEDTCFVIFGLLQDNYVDYLIESYKNINDKIVSTWKDQDKNLIEKLENNGFKIVLNDLPKVKNSTNFQIIHNRNGSKKALEFGYKYSLNLRTDLVPNNPTRFREVLKLLIQEKLSSLAWFGHHRGYILNHFICGPCEEVMNFYGTTENESDTIYSEKFMQENYFKKENITFEETQNKFNYCIKELKDNSISFFWIKYPDHPEIVNHFYNIEKNYPQHYIKY